MANFWQSVNKVIYESDILIILLDARLVNETRNIEIENKIKRTEKPILYVITKSDLVTNKDDFEKYKKELKPCVFVSSKEYHGVVIIRDKIITEAKKHNLELPVTVGILGYPNVGKSSLINAMSNRGSASTSVMSGHTKGVKKIKDKHITTKSSQNIC